MTHTMNTSSLYDHDITSTTVTSANSKDAQDDNGNHAQYTIFGEDYSSELTCDSLFIAVLALEALLVLGAAVVLGACVGGMIVAYTNCAATHSVSSLELDQYTDLIGGQNDALENVIV